MTRGSSLALTAAGNKHYIFPGGFPAHWIRIPRQTDCIATAEFIYT